MLRALLTRLGLSDDGADGDEEDEEEDKGFVPSRLDASVLEAHGMGTTAAERELASIEEKAEVLDSERLEEHSSEARDRRR